jgi:hypothetical protein
MLTNKVLFFCHAGAPIILFDIPTLCLKEMGIGWQNKTDSHEGSLGAFGSPSVVCECRAGWRLLSQTECTAAMDASEQFTPLNRGGNQDGTLGVSKDLRLRDPILAKSLPHPRHWEMVAKLIDVCNVTTPKVVAAHAEHTSPQRASWPKGGVVLLKSSV